MNDVFPPPFETRMLHQLEQQWDLFAAAHHQPTPTSIRVNPKKNKSPITGKMVPWCSFGQYLRERPLFTLDPSLHGGAYYVQEASSMFLEQAFKHSVDATQSLVVLDLCAAPGGKSTHLLSLMSEESLLVSNEVIRSRANILHENLQKWGNSNTVVTNSDPQHFQRLEGLFDVIVIDAPCSGEGLFRKDPSARIQWSEDNVILCSKRQRRIISEVWPALKENGILIYSTCTYSPAENEENLSWLRASHDVEFVPIPLKETWNIETVTVDRIIGYRFYPHRVEGEGLFMTVIRKKEKSNTIKVTNQKKAFGKVSKKLIEKLETWIVPSQDFTFIERDHLIQFFPSRHAEQIEFLSRNLRILSAGTFLATIKQEKAVPEHSLALSNHVNKENLKTISVSREDALNYLRKDPISVTHAEKGFALVQYEDLALGWVNVLSNRSNNMYPSEWRIRMK